MTAQCAEVLEVIQLLLSPMQILVLDWPKLDPKGSVLQVPMARKSGEIMSVKGVAGSLEVTDLTPYCASVGWCIDRSESSGWTAAPAAPAAPAVGAAVEVERAR